MTSASSHTSLRWRLQFTAEYLAARLAVAALGALGWQRASRFAGWIGRLAHRPLGIRRAIVESQIAAALPELDAAARDRVARRAYDSIVRTFVETAIAPAFDQGAILARMARVDGWEHLEAALAGGRGVMLLTGHIGNWEFGGAYMAARGVPIDVIAKRVANPRVDQWLAETRERIGMRVIFDDDAVRATPRALKQGRAVAFLCDQDARGLASTFVPFLGRPARTPRGPAVFALRLDVPMLFVTILRERDGRYTMQIEPVALPVRTGDRDADIDAIVYAYTRVLEAKVRATPSQYFWLHRRWKRQPPAGWEPPPLPAMEHA